MKDFQAQVFCITGVIPGISRGDIWNHIAARDGEFVERMNKSVTILVVGERGQGTTKYEKALQYGTTTMEYEQFMAWLFRTPVIDPDAHLRPLNKPKRIGGAHVVAPMAATVQGSSFAEFLSKKTGIKVEDVRCEKEDVSMVQGSNLKPQISNLKSPTSTLKILSKVAAALLAILIMIGKAALVVCGLSICVVLWLCGIPVGKP